ncbi:hypothetical protein JCM19992_10650 [Thermostilla marina]
MAQRATRLGSVVFHGLIVATLIGVLSIGTSAIAKPKKQAQKEVSAPAAEQADDAKPETAEAKPAEDKSPEAEKPAEEKPAQPQPAEKATQPSKPSGTTSSSSSSSSNRYTVKSKTLKIVKSYKATFVPAEAEEIVLRPKAWSTLRVEEAVPHGRSVRKGEVILRLDTEAIDRAIADQKLALASQELSLKEATELLKIMERTVPFDLESAQIAHRQFTEDYQQYQEKDRELSIRSAEMSLKSARESLEYEEEELRQLENMYKADDLTEETEEIILKRQRAAVERARFYYELAKRRHELFQEFDLPRNDQAWERDKFRQDVSLQRSQISLPVLLQQQRITVEQQKIALERAKKKLDELVADRELMVVTAPCDGIVYYGRFSHGKWDGASTKESKLVPLGTLTANDVVMTIVPERSNVVQFTVSEADRRWIEKGLEGTATLTIDPHTVLPVVVTETADVPISAGQFETRAEVDLPLKSPVVPAMTCSLRFVPYYAEDALVVPSKAVFSEDLDPSAKYVYVAGEDGKPQRRDVKVGEQSGEEIEILRGLREGEVILTSKP